MPPKKYYPESFPAKEKHRHKRCLYQYCYLILSVSILTLDQFNAEIQFLSCHFVVGVQGDHGLIFGCHRDRERLAGHILQIDPVSHFQVLGTGQLVCR